MIIMRYAETLHSAGDQAALFALGIACFAVPLQGGFLVVGLLRRSLSRFAQTPATASL